MPFGVHYELTNLSLLSGTVFLKFYVDPILRLYHFSSIASHISTTASKYPGLCLIVRVFFSTLLPGFIGPESSVLPIDLSPSV